jgi:hypothetical protein
MELIVLVVLAALLLLLAGGLIWQERNRVPEPQGAVVYGSEEAVAYVWDRLPDAIRTDVGRAGVRRILEWELHYLQQPMLRGERPAVIGGIEAAEYVQDEAYRHGYPYEPEPILTILELQAAYLADLGAVGDRVEEELG